MWTSSILLILSMFSAEAAEMEQSVRAQVAIIRAAETPPAIVAAAQVAAAEVVVAKAKAPARQVRKAVAPKAPATKAVAPVAVAPVAEPAPIATPSLEFGAVPASFVLAQPMVKIAVPSKAQIIVGKVQSFYNNTKSFTASFSQTVTNSTFSKLKPKASSGKVYILKPGKMRWDYQNESYNQVGSQGEQELYLRRQVPVGGDAQEQAVLQRVTRRQRPACRRELPHGHRHLLNDFNVTLDTSGKYGSKDRHPLAAYAQGALGSLQEILAGRRPDQLLGQAERRAQLQRRYQLDSSSRSSLRQRQTPRTGTSSSTKAQQRLSASPCRTRAADRPRAATPGRPGAHA